MAGFVDYYQILGLNKATFKVDEVKKAFWKEAQKFHPDKFPEGSDAQIKATETFKNLNEAQSVLSDERKRIKYDEIYAKYELEEIRRKLDEAKTDKGTTPEGVNRQVHTETENDFKNFRVEFDLNKINVEMERQFGKGKLGELKKEMEEMFGRPGETQEELFRRLNQKMETRRKHEGEVRKAESEVRMTREAAERKAFMDAEISMPSADRYLVAAMTKMLNDDTSQEIRVLNDNGDVLWEVGLLRSRKNGPEFRVKRSLEDLVPGKVIEKIDPITREKKLREVKPGETFSPDEINNLNPVNQGVEVPGGRDSRIPAGYFGHIRDLGDLAIVLADPEKFDTRKSDSKLLDRITHYNETNDSIFPTEPGMKLQRLTEGLVNERFLTRNDAREGKPPVI